MSNDIKIGLTLDDNGSIAGKNKDAKELKQTLMQTAEVAQKIRVPQAVRSAAAPTGMGETKTARSIGQGAGTGSSASDFAAQAQGLGGLVHVYATFAANLYAVSAAFSALSKAADTTNMVKGLDQLSAQSGRSLGSLAKQMVAVTDGTISMQQAMTSTALASSGGMTNTAILRMTEVAKKASLALGRDMPDSMDRLTKGIVKVQPELLDELGIMARVIPAQQAYAKAVGKSVGDLTEFEKRQAFANAVLTEGEAKFSAISLQANPYSKIAASTDNLIQSSLELVNKVLSPLLTILSSSPTALGVALAFIGKTLLSMALPAIGQWKKGLDVATEAARQNVIETNAQRVAHRKNIDSILAEKTATDDLTATKKANLAIENLTNKSSAKTKRLLPETANAVDTQGLDLLEKQNLALKKQADLLETKISTLKNPAAIARNTEELNGIRATTKALDEKIVAGRAYQALESETYSKFQYFTKAAADARLADAAAAKSQRTAITKATSEGYQKGGMAGGWEALTSGINNAKKGLDTAGVAFDNNQKAMTGWNAAITRATGMGVIAIGVFETIAAAMSEILLVVGVVVAVFELLDYAFSKNSKQAEEAASALDNLAGASKTANDVLKDLEGRNPLYKISTAAMTAKANAILEVGDAAAKAFKAVKEQDESASWWDRLVDTGKVLLGSNLLRKSSIELAKSVANSFKLASPGAETTKALKEIKDLTGVDPRDQEAFKSYLNDTPEKFLEIVPKVTAVMQQLGTDLSVTASKGKEFDDAFKTAGATFDSILAGMMPSDNLAKLGFETVDVAKKMGKALQDPTTALTKLVEISGDTSKLRFFSPEVAADLYKASPQIKSMAADIAAYTAALDVWKQKEEDLNKERQAAIASKRPTTGIDQELAKNKQSRDLLVNVLDPLKAKIQPYIDTLNKEQTAVFENGAKLVADSIGVGFEKARITVAKAAAQGLGDTAQGIQVRANLDKKAIDIQIRQIEAQSSLSTVMDSLRIIEEERLVFDQQNALDIKQEERRKKGESATPAEAAKESKLRGELINRRVGIEIAKELQTATLDAVMGSLKSPVGSARYIAANIALPGAQQRAGAMSQTAQLKGEKTAIDIGANYAQMDHEIKVQKDLKATESERLNTELQQLDIRVKNALYLDQALLTEKQRVTEQIALNKEASDNLDIQNEINKAKRAGGAGKPGENAMTAYGMPGISAVTELQGKLAQQQERQRQAGIRRALGYGEEASAAGLGKQAFIDQQAKDKQDAGVKAEQNRVAIAKERFNLLSGIGALDAKSIIDANAEVALDEAKKTNAQTLFDMKQAFDKQDADLKAKLAQQAPGSAEAKAIQDQIDLKKTYYDQSIIGENNLLTAKTNSITQQQAYNTLLDGQRLSMEKMTDTTANLTTLFGDLGTSIGKAGEAIIAMAQEDTRYLEQKNALEAAQKDPTLSAKQQADATKSLIALEDKHSSDKIKNQINVLGAVKKVFGQETAAYKILDTMEKVSSATKLYNDNKELISTVVTLGKKAAIELGFLSASVTAEEAADMAKATSKIPAVMMEFMSWLGPWGTVAGAAAIAAVLGGGGGGGGSSIAAPAQYATGTATDMAGNATGTGKGGDVNAQNTSLQDSLSVLSAVAKPQFNQTSKMVKSLASIDNAMTGFLMAVAPTMGITSTAANEAVGATNTGLSGTQKLVGGATSGALVGMALGGPLGALAGALVGPGQIQNVTNAISGLLGGDGMTLSGGTAVSASGIDIQKQTLAAAAIEAQVQNFTDTWTEIQHDGPWGYNSYKESHPGPSFAEAVDSATQNALTAINANILTTYTQAAKILKVDDALVAKQEINIGKINKLGLSADDYVKKVEAEYGKFTDQIATVLIPNISDFQQRSESVGTTFLRLSAGMDEASYYTDKLGIATANYNDLVNKRGDISAEILKKSIANIEGTTSGIGLVLDSFSGTASDTADLYTRLTGVRTSFEVLGISGDLITEKLIRSAGGIDALSQGLSDFESNFLSKSEQTAINQAKLNKEFEKIGIATPKTAEEFKKLITGLQSAGDSSDELLGRLLPLSSAVAAVAGSISETTNQEIKIYELLGKSSEALALSRQKELDAMAVGLRPRQLYINALTDETALRDKLKAAYTSSNAALANSIKTLTDYKTALTAGAASTLTPAEKYAQAKSIFMQTAAAARAVITADSSVTDIANRDAALAKIQSTGDALLGASREVNASGAQYSADFSSVTDVLDSTVSILSTQKTSQETQLDYLKTTAESTDTMATLLQKYLDAQTATALAQAGAVAAGSDAANVGYHANGGIARGLSVVGERGPELVDFATPSRVYSNQASNDLFNTKELVAEIKALREEVCQLRDDQNKQTGAIIDTTIQSNAQNAQMIAAANANLANQQDWKTRSQVRVA